MDKLWRSLSLRTVASVRAARLEIAVLAAGADLDPAVHAGHPDLEVVGAPGLEAHVAGAEDDAAVAKLEPLEDRLSVEGELLQFIIGLFRFDKLHQLNLVELMQADKAARFLSRGAGLAAEAGGVGDVAAREVLSAEDLVLVDVRERHLGGGDQVETLAGLELILLELRESRSAYKRTRVRKEGREDLRVAMLAGVRVEHQLDERPLEGGPEADVHHETRGGHLHRAFEVHDAEALAEHPVGERLEVV